VAEPVYLSATHARTKAGLPAYLSILVELVGGDVVDGEDKLDVVLLCLLNEILDLLGALRVEQGGSDLSSVPRPRHKFSWTYLDILQGLLEGEGHTTTNDQSVDLSSATDY